MDITNPLKLIGVATDVAKTLLTAETIVEKAQLQLQMADVLGALASARVALIEADTAVRERDAEIVRLHQAREEKGDLIEGSGGLFWKSDGKGNKVGYPCCPSCLVKDGRQVQMVKDGKIRKGRCPKCGERYESVSYWNPPRNDGEASSEEPAYAARSLADLGRDLA